MDPQSLLMVVTDSGKNLKLNQQIVNEQMKKLVQMHKATVRRPAQPKSRAKRPAPAHAQPPKKPRVSQAVDNAANSAAAAPAEPVKLSSKAIGTEKECQEMRLRLQTAESRLLHSARVNAMLSQGSRLICVLAAASPLMFGGRRWLSRMGLGVQSVQILCSKPQTHLKRLWMKNQK